ncbi:MAG TPA: helix-turn-helix transcriptional regulator, partial [Candidatus Xenobia bacterium]
MSVTKCVQHVDVTPVFRTILVQAGSQRRWPGMMWKFPPYAPPYLVRHHTETPTSYQDEHVIFVNKTFTRQFEGERRLLIPNGYSQAMNMKSIRLERGLTQTALGRLAGVHQSDVSRIETGQIDDPAKQQRIDAVLGVKKVKMEEQAALATIFQPKRKRWLQERPEVP